ncbi:MAG: hypothetical protein HN348_29115 [Proteobacteria bacterium]|nr:hypothetical protein [Pseudomonadota bacterium]
MNTDKTDETGIDTDTGWQWDTSWSDTGWDTADTGLAIVTVSNVDDEACTLDSAWASLSPSAGEEGHRAAARLEPPAYPFNVTAARIVLFHDYADCLSGGEYSVQVYVDGSNSPPSTPAPIVTALFPPVLLVGNFRTFQISFTPALELTGGDQLFISVDFDGKSPITSCVAMCTNQYQANTNYWSNADNTPYPWATLETYSINSNIWAEMDGYL